MKMLMIVLMTLLLASCQDNSEGQLLEPKEDPKSAYEMKCEQLNNEDFHRIKRCENEEVICYIMGDGHEDGHSSCQFKNTIKK